MRIASRLGVFSAFAVVIAIVLTSLVLIYFWSWLNPIDFWQKLVAVLVTVVSAIGLFLVFLFGLIILFSPFISKYRRKRLRRPPEMEPMFE